ncbi:MAG: putative adenylate cyclase, partial [Marinimicrobia bacterium 46_43]
VEANYHSEESCEHPNRGVDDFGVIILQ